MGRPWMFALDPVVVIFFKKCQKNYKCWIKWISKKFTTIGSANTCNFFWKWKKIDFKKKNTTMGFKWCFDPIVVIFFEIKNFSFPKKFTSVAWSSRCKFFWNALDPTLVIFLTFFEKNYNDWIKCKLSKSQTKWTGLKSIKLFRITLFFGILGEVIISYIFSLIFRDLLTFMAIWARFFG